MPKLDSSQQPRTDKVFKFIRPLPASRIGLFTESFSQLDFTYLEHLPLNEMIENLEEQIESLICSTFPQKRILVSSDDQPWFTEELRALKRKRQREYQKHGKSQKYLDLLESFNAKSKLEIEKYKQEIANQVAVGERGSCYTLLRRLDKRSGQTKSSSFTLPEHSKLCLTSAQSVELIANHFTQISAEYQPLDVGSLPPYLREYLAAVHIDDVPKLSVREVTQRIRKAKKPNSFVQGDLPRKLIQSCTETLAIPATIIFNRISQTANYPEKWKMEHQIAIPKVSQPQCEDDLRNIAKTPFLSKVYEYFLANWLLSIIQPYLDPGQCGLKGLSINHYLIRLLHFVHSSLDLRKPQAVIAACIDLGKAFNRVDHSLVIQDLYDMKTPSWLLNILVSYLSNRSMVMTYQGAQSNKKDYIFSPL